MNYLLFIKEKKKTLLPPCRYNGYTHRIVVEVNGQEIFFEPDEERNYRAIINYENLATINTVDRELVQAIGDIIHKILK